MFTFDARPTNVVQAWHQLAHFFKDALRALWILPVHAKCVRQVDQNLNVWTGITGAGHHLTTALNLAVCIGERTILFIVGGCREDHVSMPCCFGQEDVLHDQEIQLSKRRAGVVLVWI